jgi:hypothetical protein
LARKSFSAPLRQAHQAARDGPFRTGDRLDLACQMIRQSDSNLLTQRGFGHTVQSVQAGTPAGEHDAGAGRALQTGRRQGSGDADEEFAGPVVQDLGGETGLEDLQPPPPRDGTSTALNSRSSRARSTPTSRFTRSASTVLVFSISATSAVK